ncbi:DUF1178 family protein [Emcibacter sp. SYSU 3D8]|uniref:DUF1178 family protein n=1 Tax=Emcibacter sp. SYSU 3D8 TaxID=3133969 RepID=UPI0031FE5B9C
MIKYELRCRGCEHQFEGWFADSATYDVQAGSGDIQCPMCSGADVGKAIMAPNVSVRRDHAQPSSAQIAAEVRRVFMEIRRKVEDNCDYVGTDFADEARKIHSGKADDRGIYGETTEDEAEELRDEGIDIVAIPWLPRSDA